MNLSLKWSSWISLFIILQLARSSCSLRCYKCAYCNNDAVIEECSSSENVCLTLHAGKLVSKQCSRKELCSVKKIEEGLNYAWGSIQKAFGSEIKEVPEFFMNCCETDFCNGAPSTASLGLFGLLLLGVAAMQPWL